MSNENTFNTDLRDTTIAITNHPCRSHDQPAAPKPTTRPPSRSIADMPIMVWRDAAEQLTEWVVKRLVVHYFDFGSQEPSVFIRRHFRRDFASEGPLWLHPVSRDNTSKWFLIEVKHRGNDPAERAAVNWQAAIGWYEELQRRGFRPLLLDPGNGNSFELLVLLSEQVSSQRVLTFVENLVSDHAARGLPQAPDIMPNLADIAASWRGTKRWRLLGLDSSNLVATRVWSGDRWLVGKPAIEMILGTTGDSPELITAVSSASSGQAQPLASSVEQFARYLLDERIDPEVIEEVALLWNNEHNQTPGDEQQIREIVRGLVRGKVT